ncbi:MAG: RNA methyltransferase [bacterium]|nr:RNA methyltransferase [bacterium]
MNRHPLYVIAHNIRSVHNVGSFFRTCDATNVKKLYLTGYTPTPIDRFGRTRADVTKTALGAEKTVAWEQQPDIFDLLTALKQEGVAIVALEQSERSLLYSEYEIKKPTALIVGNEPDGIAEQILALCDAVIEIPMYGEKESLNVSVSLGVALYQLGLKKMLHPKA